MSSTALRPGRQRHRARSGTCLRGHPQRHLEAGISLGYGGLAVPDKRLPVRGFGKAWLDNEYVRTSLGYPTSDEFGGFAELNYEPFEHPTRGHLLIWHMTVHMSDGQEWKTNVTIPNATTPGNRRNLSMACGRILIQHRS